ncbi:glycosyltransferase family 2 protein [Desulfocurvibacter africanus]|uniref:glycosyltransferase family 2 protein n=1 Tax=Desulfocurvibacter africanus TaxID=873 RepID=UPI00048235D9|nr:glycosyltransferase family 2 protein [Desulfocurvibacter africanus]
MLNYKGAADTLICVEALQRLETAPRRIIIVDNGSGEEEVARLKDGWTTLAQKHGGSAPVLYCEGDPLPEASKILLPLGENGGFSSGNNVGLRLAMQDECCRAFWLLNNDTEPAPDALDALCARLNQRQDAGFCGSTLCYAHEPDMVQCAGGCTLSPLTGVTAFLLGGKPLSAVISRDPEPIENGMAYVCGASLLARRGTLEGIGLLAEEYFLYYEDAEWGMRALRAGYGLAWAPASRVLHKEGGSSGAAGARDGRTPRRSRLVDYLSLRNRVWLMRNYYPAALPLTLLSYLGVILNRIKRGQIDRIGLVLVAAWDGLKGNIGKPRARLAAITLSEPPGKP